ncbi:MAG TPA: 2-oxoglutarate dehydrogenase complex dihydrolipoyllysine-residue succinyltransferase [Phycisphaerales bacterium]|nr:2-oxoglutarate dehydrogenase complex dihydrolipoyllysine-residue succinyltransferase [Phycisphaerales bacterium]HRQ74725.1 2-oxoglutarate dehydrogenase complex dihydrolipoyllysine-residue succinyltransferase [Phycisphaerales bacterium]
MPVQITIPSPGESITEVTLGPWHKADGEWVEKDETLVEIESDKVTLEVPAPESGLLSISAKQGDEKNVGDVIGAIDPNAAKPSGNGQASKPKAETSEPKSKPAESKVEKDTARNERATAAAANEGKVTSLARKIAQEQGVNLAGVKGTGPSGRVTKSDVLAVRDKAPAAGTAIIANVGGSRGVRREKMTKLRQRIAQRLVQAQHTAAMLTTFNECDMTAVMDLRSRHKDAFAEKYGVGLGFMSFFSHACVSALKAFPRVNAYIVGDEIEYHDYIDISVAVGTDKGLVVPVLRNVEQMSFADIEQTIKELATKARDGKLTVEDMTGGTFTISNGGVYGSLNSTPILNPPQSGILGLHKIMKRPVEDPTKPGQIALRPMMYIAMSYDHRIVDGAEAVGFLVHVKNCIENPERMLLGL